MPVFSSKKTQQGVYAAEEAKEKTQTESKQKACMGMEMPDSATFISGDICFFLWRGFLDMASPICVRMRVAETCKNNYKTYEENQKNYFYYIIVRVDLHPTQSSTWNTSSTSILKYFDIRSINSADGVLSPRSILPTVLVLYPIAAARFASISLNTTRSAARSVSSSVDRHSDNWQEIVER